MKAQDDTYERNGQGNETNPKKATDTRNPQPEEKIVPRPPHGAAGPSLAKISLAALGVVFGDIATSPLYAIRECFHGKYGIAATPENLLVSYVGTLVRN